MFKFIKKLIKKILKKPPDCNGLEGKIIKATKKEISFQRSGKYFKVKRDKDRVIYDNYNDWKLIQTWKGREGQFLNIWEASKNKQVRNWNFGNVSKGEKLLEVGFRDGYNLKYLMEKGIYVEGIDVNSIAIAAANNLGCKTFEEDIQKKTHYEDKTFDVISACDVLEHCFSPENALKEMYRMLKDDGRVTLDVPLEKKFNRSVLHGHSVLFYNYKNFEKLVDSIGFYIVKKDVSIRQNCLFILKKKIEKNKF